MSRHTKHIEKIVRGLRADGVTYFYKRRGNVTGCEDHVVPYSDTTPKLKWDEFTGENYSPEFVWLLYYFDGKQYSKIYIPPDNTRPEGVEKWYYSVHSLYISVQQEKDHYGISEPVDHKARIEDAIKGHTDTYSSRLGESDKLCLASARLSSLRDEIDEMESSLHEQLWKIVYTAYKAGREAEYSSSADGAAVRYSWPDVMDALMAHQEQQNAETNNLDAA